MAEGHDGGGSCRSGGLRREVGNSSPVQPTLTYAGPGTSPGARWEASVHVLLKAA